MKNPVRFFAVLLSLRSVASLLAELCFSYALVMKISIIPLYSLYLFKYFYSLYDVKTISVAVQLSRWTHRDHNQGYGPDASNGSIGRRQVVSRCWLSVAASLEAWQGCRPRPQFGDCCCRDDSSKSKRHPKSLIS